MSEQLKRHLGQLKKSPCIRCLGEIGHGIEKESLRVDAAGHIAQTPHPAGLGSALTHPYVTTDFSEALLEFVTPVFRAPRDSLAFLEDLHGFVYGQLPGEEFLWTCSMPCILDADESIPIAHYGSSNIGRLKTLYRVGLSYRYGRAMQTIAGIHYNFSLPDEFWTLYHRQLGSGLSLQDFKTEQYFNLIRNFRRYSWLLIYLFGASPAICKSFLKDGAGQELERFDTSTLYMPYGTSLRMGDLGYTSLAQQGLYICYNSLAEYIAGLKSAINTPYPPYEKFIGPDGGYAQLNTGILQIENEFYGTIRPKRAGPAGSRSIHVLPREGVEYIEVRCLDLNPFLPAGMDAEEIHFLNGFLVFCLLRASPPTDQNEFHEIAQNLAAVVSRGRDPNLLLRHGGREIHIRDWAREIIEEALELAELMDTLAGNGGYTEAVQAQLAKVEDAALTPSAKMLQRMRELDYSYFTFATGQSLAAGDYFKARSPGSERIAEFQRILARSKADQAAMEAADDVDFDTFLRRMNESARMD